MNVDMDKIGRVEDFIIANYKNRKGSVKGSLRTISIVMTLSIAISLLIGLNIITNLDEIESMLFYFSLLLIPVIAASTVIVCTYRINNVNNKNKVGFSSTATGAVAGIMALLATQIRRNFPPDTANMIYGIIFIAIALFLVNVATTFVYKLYLLHKYAPYFKDERLRHPAAPLADEEKNEL